MLKVRNQVKKVLNDYKKVEEIEKVYVRECEKSKPMSEDEDNLLDNHDDENLFKN